MLRRRLRRHATSPPPRRAASSSPTRPMCSTTMSPTLAIGLMLCAARQLPAADRHVREGKWPAGNHAAGAQDNVPAARLGIVGMGRIGQAIAQRALAFGMPVAYHARNPRPSVPYRYVASAVGAGRRERSSWSSSRPAARPRAS